MDLERDSIDLLRRFGMEMSFPEGATILRRGDEGNAFYVITSGEAEVQIDNEDGNPLRLMHLPEGSFFGEISLLTSVPITADVVASAPVTVLVCTRDDFFSALDSSEGLSKSVSRVLASRLASNTVGMISLHMQREALNTLMASGGMPEPLFALSPAMKSVESFIGHQTTKAAKGILLHGSAGTGKVFVASLLHRARLHRGAPFIVVDCRLFCCEEVGSILFGAHPDRNRATCAETAASPRNCGALNLADQGTLVLRHIDSLGMPFQEMLLDHLDDTANDGERTRFQLIVTTRKNPGELEEGGLLHPRIERMMEHGTLRIPNLFERRRDILPLAKYFLQRCEGHGAFSYASGAEKKLLTAEYGHRNVTELREAVETATQVTEGVLIGAEHLFLDAGDQAPPREFAVARSPFLRRLTRPGTISFMRTVILASFLAVMGASILRAGFPEGRLANTLIWSLWEPLLFVSFFTVGRVWCTICPLSTFGRFFSRMKSFGLPPPEWLKRNAGFIFTAGFAAIIWAEHYFIMLENPLPSGILLFLLFATAGLFAVLYERETWCRHACPLGALGAALGIPAVLTVRANRHICANYCSSHECYKGTGNNPGCPTSRHPLQGTEAHTCKLCLSCIENCPHGAARLYIRPPLRGVWHLGDVGEPMVLFGFFLFLFGPAMLASQGNTWAATDVGFGVTTMASILLALVACRQAPDMLKGYTASRGVLLSRVSLALAVLAWGPAMAYQMYHLPALSAFVLHLRSDASAVVHPPEIPVIFVVQVLLILMATMLSAICFWRIRHEASDFVYTTWDLGWKFLTLICAAYILLNVFLVVPGSP